MSFKSPSPLAPLPPHPATVVQRRSPHPATLAPERALHPAATFHCCPGALTTSRTAQRSTFGPDTDWYCPKCGAATKAYSETPPFGKCVNCGAKPNYDEWSKTPELTVEREQTITVALSEEAKAKETDWETLLLCFGQWTKGSKEIFEDKGDWLYCNVGGNAEDVKKAGKNTNPHKAVQIKPPKAGSFTHLGMLVAEVSHGKGTNVFIGVAANAYLVWDSETPLSRWQWQNSKVSEGSRNVCHTEQLCLSVLHAYLLTLSDVTSLSLAWWTQKDLCGWCQYAEGAFEMYWFKTKGVVIAKKKYTLFK